MEVVDVTGDAAQYRRLELLCRQWLGTDLAVNGAPSHTCGAYADWQQGRRLHHLSAWEMDQWAPAPEAATEGYTKRVLELVDDAGPLAVLLAVPSTGRLSRLAIDPLRAEEAMAAARDVAAAATGETYGRIDAPEVLRIARSLARARPIERQAHDVLPGRERPPPRPKGR